MTAIGSLKGGVSKSTVCYELASTLALDHEVVIVSLDSNRSGHDRFVQPHHREVIADAFGERDELWPSSHRLNALLDDPAPDVDGHYLYRRDDLPNLGVLYHDTGTLSGLASQVMAPGARRRYQDLLDYLQGNYDFVFLDCPPDFENVLVGEALSRADMLLPVMDLSSDGLNAVRETYFTALDADIPVHGLVISPFHQRNSTRARVAAANADVFAARHSLALHRIPEDATVVKAQDDSCPLVLYRPPELARKSGYHEFDVRPPRALASLQELGEWLAGCAQRSDQLSSSWQRRRSEFIEQRQRARASA